MWKFTRALLFSCIPLVLSLDEHEELIQQFLVSKWHQERKSSDKALETDLKGKSEQEILEEMADNVGVVVSNAQTSVPIPVDSVAVSFLPSADRSVRLDSTGAVTAFFSFSRTEPLTDLGTKFRKALKLPVDKPVLEESDHPSCLLDPDHGEMSVQDVVKKCIEADKVDAAGVSTIVSWFEGVAWRDVSENPLNKPSLPFWDGWPWENQALIRRGLMKGIGRKNIEAEELDPAVEIPEEVKHLIVPVWSKEGGAAFGSKEGLVSALSSLMEDTAKFVKEQMMEFEDEDGSILDAQDALINDGIEELQQTEGWSIFEAIYNSKTKVKHEEL
uniref:Uncharacterized protein n=1 Tax=Chromera velia CCMP2878 TaxID=1169474 RepID=A0A0G4HDT0_9ALVE|mmetsp:Transcript_8946/g.17459  ORF Transcript_8946/g.17459 Transcript_8946/m.17459 type:complete len:330 (-) Transcript_8946:441-1430(-)|eukprot:Cvel_6472.t1-p1 / transcript=Cvel_6472.t1 / gene=Cvel_6472 / organism=Chromera_velia_CCMP2878 / gene_product=Vegetative cell wall protein gp1, putative / transcript_product=Vegetative cell wall protein gp1, putative / location=Cvel_scaffold317:78420-81127(-) / protein_length=329 / sequence_SO=supercontig / SO=protein_coding / is_pseudo=false